MDEVEIPSKLQEYFDLLRHDSQYMLTFSPFFINHFAVNLISDFVVNRKKALLYMCVGRPHMFVQKILQNRGVTTRNLHFMDMVLYVCRQSDKPNKTKIYFNEEGEVLDLPTVYKVFKVDQEVEDLKMDDIDIIILDNISELRTYNNDDQIESFLSILKSVSDKTKNGLLLLRFNNKPNDGLEQMGENLGIESLEIPNDSFR